MSFQISPENSPIRKPKILYGINFDVVQLGNPHYKITSVRNHDSSLQIITSFSHLCAEQFYLEISDFKKKGVEKIILDLRNNPGGNGHKLESLLSIFIDKPHIIISKREPPLELNHKLFISGVKCYILMDQGTSSTAASFCNILQFNGVAKLVGEPLMHNAMKYGEIICPARRFPNESFPGNIVEASISTVESNEYTKAVDGILMPDIIIPYVAKEYMSGDDSILSKLLLNKISSWNLN